MPLATFCKGMIVAARIYADVPNNKCSCGGSFTRRISHPDDKDLIVPKCTKCDSYPSLFLIDADALDVNGAKIRIKIRNTQNGERLDRMSKVSYTLERVLGEIKEGTFDVRKYASSTTREAFIFKNFVGEYLKLQECKLRDNQITPKGLKDKIGLINRELLPFFSGIDICSINGPMINKFKNSYMSKNKDRTRDLALGDLKAILRQAVKEGLLNTLPPFDPIDKAKTRDEVVSMELAIKTISLMHKQIHRDIYTLLITYPMRPCEARALKWRNINFEQKEFTVDHHFSDEVLIAGRKSIKSGKMSTMTYPITSEALEIFLRCKNKLKVVPINLMDEFIFKNPHGNHVSEESVSESWRNARKKAGHSFKAYECRHAVSGEIYARSGNDLLATSEATGHTNTGTLSSRYLRVKIDKKKLYNA